jgi:hypothetical protein
MVPQRGEISNPESLLLADWNATHKNKSGNADSTPEGLDFESLFKTLEDWADYLEKDVPYFQEGPK